MLGGEQIFFSSFKGCSFEEAVLLSDQKRAQLHQKQLSNYSGRFKTVFWPCQSHWWLCSHMAKNVILKKKKKASFTLWLVTTFEKWHLRGNFQHIVDSPIAQSRAADLSQSQSEPRINIRVELRSWLSPLRSPGVLAGHFLFHVTGPLLLTMIMLTYCMCHTIIILKIHSKGEAKTMSVSTDVHCCERPHNGDFCWVFGLGL